MGRVFRDHRARAAFLRERLEPAAARLRGRPELAIFRTPIALLEPASMAVHVFPIDPELPPVGDATDRRRLIELLGARLPDVREGHFAIRDCRVEVANYARWPFTPRRSAWAAGARSTMNSVGRSEASRRCGGSRLTSARSFTPGMGRSRPTLGRPGRWNRVSATVTSQGAI